MKYLSFDQGSPEWLELRRTRVTATDMAILLGCENCITPLQLWERKMGLAAPVYVTDAMRRGNELEQLVRDIYADETGIPVMPACVESEEYPWLMASLDGISPEGTRIVEIKCPLPENIKDNIDPIPEKYYIQMQAQLLCTGLSKCAYCVYDGHTGTALIDEVFADPELHNRMIEAGKAFYHCILTKTPPPLTDRDCQRREDCEWRFAIEQAIDAKKRREEAEDYEEECRQKVIALCDDQSTEGCGIRCRKGVRKGNVEYNKIEALKGINLDLYRKSPIITWTITEAEVKDYGAAS